MDTSPTPGASDVDYTKRNKNKQTEFVFKTKSKRDMVLQQSQIKEKNIICDYSIAEQTEINIQNSTKESKIKVLI
jgi:hypothetical protein